MSLPFAKLYSSTLIFTKISREKIAKIWIHADSKTTKHVRDVSAEDTLAFDYDTDEEKAKAMSLHIKKFRQIIPTEETGKKSTTVSPMMRNFDIKCNWLPRIVVKIVVAAPIHRV